MGLYGWLTKQTTTTTTTTTTITTTKPNSETGYNDTKTPVIP